MNTTACLPTQETTPDIAPPTPEELARVTTTIEKSLRTWKGNSGFGRFLEVELHALRSLGTNAALIEQLYARLTCCCGDNVEHSSWAGHSPVSMYDHALDRANEEIANLKRSVAPPIPEELRVLCRLAWNNWPDSETSRREIAKHEARDAFSARAWDRVVTVIHAAAQR